MKKTLAVMALIASTGAACAADMPQAQPYTRAPVAGSPAYNWTGFYIGAMGGYGWSNQVNVAGFTVNNADINGGFAGGTAGFNYQAPGSMFVFGVEADGAWSDIQHTVGVVGLASFQERIQVFGSVTGRVGVAVDSVLLYGKGGYGWAENQISATFLGLAGSESHFHNGWTVGGGVEWAFRDRWSAKAEYLFSQFPGKTNVYNTTTPPITVRYVGLEFNVVRLGVNYHFAP